MQPGLGHLARSAPECSYRSHSCTPPTPSAAAKTDKLTTQSLESSCSWMRSQSFGFAPLSKPGGRRWAVCNVSYPATSSDRFPVAFGRRHCSLCLRSKQPANTSIRLDPFDFKRTLKAKAKAQHCVDSRCTELLNSPISYKAKSKQTCEEWCKRRADSISGEGGGGAIHLATTRETPSGGHRLSVAASSKPPLRRSERGGPSLRMC